MSIRSIADDLSSVAPASCRLFCLRFSYRRRPAGAFDFVFVCANSKPKTKFKNTGQTPAVHNHHYYMHLPEPIHLWSLFAAGHSLHVLKRASLSAQSPLSGAKTRFEWLQTNPLALGIRLFVNAAAFSYWIAHHAAASHLFGSAGFPMNLTLEPDDATAAMFGLSGDSLMDWAAAKIPALQKETTAVHD